MLLRSASRRQHRHSLVPLINDGPHIHLPFLWPASLRHGSIRASTTGLARRRRSPDNHDNKPPHTRSHASLVEADSRSNLPFGSPDDLAWLSSPYHQRKPLIVDQVWEEPKSYRTNFGASVSELLQHLYACLQVGRFTRAEAIILRMKQCSPMESEMAHAHEVYLDARAQEIFARGGSVSGFQAMEEWFQSQHIDQLAGLERARLFMVKAALAMPAARSRDDLVRKYSALSGLDEETLLDSDLWTNQEYIRLGGILQGKTAEEMEIAEPTSIAIPQALANVRQEIPQIIETTQRGLGLESLRTVLEKHAESINDLPVPEKGDIEGLRSYNEFRERALEDKSAEAALERWKSEAQQLQAVGVNTALLNGSLNALMWKWHCDLVPEIQKELEKASSRLDYTTNLGASRAYVQEDTDATAAYLEHLSAEKLATLTIVQIMTLLAAPPRDARGIYTGKQGLKLSEAASHVSGVIEEEFIAKLRKKEAKIGRVRTKAAAGRPKARKKALASQIDWPLAARMKLGVMLISKFMEHAKIAMTREHPRTKEKVTKFRPAFTHRTIFSKGKKYGSILPCAEIMDKIRREPMAGIIAKRLPMLVQPVPWTSFREGGYLNFRTDFVRLGSKDQTPRNYVHAAIEKGHMQQVFHAINALGETPWIINPHVLRVQIDAWNSGEAVGNIPEADPKLEYPSEPPVSSDPNVRAKWMADVQEIDNRRSGLHSERCFQNLQLEIARAFKDDIFYLPHNVDFRGRAYPLPPYLNHMGADNVRALCMFAEGKPLGAAGLRWLKIHLASVFGFDKASFSEREKFAMDHLDDIYDSVKNPLNGRRWWLQAEDAWQTLAACHELAAALDSPDPTKFASRLPIHQDGTCNGLQHYAALGGDEVGARQVNLLPGDRPSDVYSAVAEGVIASVEKDVADGHEIAKMLHGKITRKVVKQPVMTNVYGVTLFGAREQVKRQLETILPDIKTSDKINHLTLAQYISEKIFQSLGRMFTGAQAIQDWLGVCADRIATSITPEQMDAMDMQHAEKNMKKAKFRKSVAKSGSQLRLNDQFKSTVIWTTPLSFPVVQPYREPARNNKTLQTAMSQITIVEPASWDPVSKRKQLQAFPPNFIHSLDATHMMLSAMKCKEKSVTFASIHDSFWTHACDRDVLSELLRDAFVHMHREDVIGRLREEFETRYRGCVFLATIDPKSAVAQQITKYRRSKEYKALLASIAPKLPAVDAEFLVEQQRRRLLESVDPAEKEKGRAIVTPASILEGARAHKAILTAADTTTLGFQQSTRQMSEGKDDNEVDNGSDSGFLHRAQSSLDHNASEAELRQQLLGDELPDESGAQDYEMKAAVDEVDESVEDDFSTKKRSGVTGSARTTVWMPLTFPPVPKKGTFDVAQLKQSKYFFH